MGKHKKRRRDSSGSSQEASRKKSRQELQREIRALKERLTRGSSKSHVRPHKSEHRLSPRSRSRNVINAKRAVLNKKGQHCEVHAQGPSTGSRRSSYTPERSHESRSRSIERQSHSPDPSLLSSEAAEVATRRRSNKRQSSGSELDSDSDISDSLNQNTVGLTETNPTQEVEGILLNEDVLDDELLNVLGEEKENKKELIVHSIIKNRWQTILSKGLDKEERNELIEKHIVPSNIKTLNAPEMNPEILAALPSSAVTNERYQISRQTQLGRGISALGAALNILLKTNAGDNTEARNQILQCVNESGRLLTDLHYRMSLTRRAVITPYLDKTVKKVTKDTPVGELLFGSNLGEKIKSAKAVERSGKDLKQPFRSQLSSNYTRKQVHMKEPLRADRSLNYKGPSRYRREPRQEGHYPQTQRRRGIFRRE